MLLCWLRSREQIGLVVEDKLSVARMVMTAKEKRERPEMDDGLEGLQILATEGKCRNQWARWTTRSEIAMDEHAQGRERELDVTLYSIHIQEIIKFSQGKQDSTDGYGPSKAGKVRDDKVHEHATKIKTTPYKATLSCVEGKMEAKRPAAGHMNALRTTKQDDAGVRRASKVVQGGGHGDVIDKGGRATR